MEYSKIIIKPLVSEKSYALQNAESKKYAFYVDPKATKDDIKSAFESIYGFAPKKVCTLLRKPVNIRTGTLKPGMTKLTKIAYITLPKGKTIETTEEENKESEKKSDGGKK